MNRQNTLETEFAFSGEPGVVYRFEVRASEVVDGMFVRSDWAGATVACAAPPPAPPKPFLACADDDVPTLFLMVHRVLDVPADMYEYETRWELGSSGTVEPVPDSESGSIFGGAHLSLVEGQDRYQFAVRSVRVFAEDNKVASDWITSDEVTCLAPSA